MSDSTIMAAMDFTMNHEMKMPHLSPELQQEIERLRDELASRGTPAGTTGKGIDGAMYMATGGKIEKLTAFETGFLMGRMYEQNKGKVSG
jgi:hypothetical protein